MNKLQTRIAEFLYQYGEQELLTALDNYANTHHKYLCKTRASITKLNIYDIYYIKIHGHNMRVHTEQETYSKYGSLSQELKQLSKYGFIKCSHNCIVSLDKVKQICHDELLLVDGTKLHISRSCVANVLIAYAQHKSTYQSS